jgi:hypothetical protein
VSFKQQPKNEAAPSSTPYRTCSTQEATKLLPKPTRHRANGRKPPAFVLKVAKNGPKLERAEDGESTTRNGRGLIDAKTITMNRFAEVLSCQMDLLVVNHTGLEGSSFGRSPVPLQVLKISPSTGPAAGGTTVTIHGTGFIGVKKVTFGGVPATDVTIYSDSKLTADSPLAPAAKVDIQVVTPAGTSATSGEDVWT